MPVGEFVFEGTVYRRGAVGSVYLSQSHRQGENNRLVQPSWQQFKQLPAFLPDPLRLTVKCPNPRPSVSASGARV